MMDNSTPATTSSADELFGATAASQVVFEQEFASAPDFDESAFEADFAPEFDEYEPVMDFEPPASPSPRHLSTSPDVPTAVIVRTLRRVFAACHERPADELRVILAQVKAASLVLGELPFATRQTYQGVLEALEFEAANLSLTALVDLGDIPSVVNHQESVALEIEAMHELAIAKKASRNPASTFQALAEQIQAAHARRKYQEAITVIDDKAPAVDKMKAHQALIPPTTQVAVVRSSGVLTAAQLVDQHLAAKATTTGVVHSSGLLTLDLAFTAPGDPLHFIAPGEQTVIAGPTGTGKSTLQYSLTRNVAQDEINWGLYDTPIILAHTEEESWVKAKAMGLFPGQRYHHLASKIVIENIGSSRRRLAELVYDLVVAAVVKSQASARPITDFLPRIGFLDYIQSVTE